MNPSSLKAPSPLLTTRRPIWSKSLSARATRFAAALTFQSSAAFLAVFATFGFNPQALANTYTFANTAADISQAASWLGGVAPGPADIGLFNSTVTAAQADNVTLAPYTIGEIQLTNPGGAITINGTNTLTLNGVNGVGIDLSAATQNLTFGATTSGTLILASSQAWNIAPARTIDLTGTSGMAFGSNVITVNDGGTLEFNFETPGSYSTSSAGAGIVDNASTISVQVGRGATTFIPATNFLGANTAITMNGGVMTNNEAGNTGDQRQTYSSLTIGAGAAQMELGGRGTSSGDSVGFAALTRDDGGVVDFQANSTANAWGATTQAFGVGSGASATNAVGFATYGENDWLSANGDNTINSAVTYTNDTWGAGDNTTVTTNDSPGSGSTTNSLRFNNLGAFTIALSGTDIVTTGGVLVGSTTGSNAATITGGNLTSGNTNADGTHDLIFIDNNTGGGTAGNLIVNSNLVNNGANSVGLTLAVSTPAAVTGAIELGGANTFTGTGYIDGAKVLLTSAGAWNGQAPLIFAPSGTLASTTNVGSFGINGFNATVASLSTVNVSNAIVQNGSSTSQTLTINNNGAPTSFTGTIQNGGSGALNLTLSGTGTQTLGGTLTYTGLTTINSGDLIVASTPASSGYVVSGTLDVTRLANSTLNLAASRFISGSGMVSGTVSAANSAAVAPGSTSASVGGAGTLTIGGLSMAAGSSAVFGLSTINPNNSLISTGPLTLPSSGNVTLDLYNPGTSTPFAAAGTYDLFQYSSISAPATLSSAFSLGTTIAGFTSSFDLSGGFVQLVLTSSGGVNALWSNGTGNSLWSTAGNWSPAVPGNPGDAATFSQSNATPGTVTLTAPEALGTLVFSNNSGQGFTLTGGQTLTMNNLGNGAGISTTGTSTIDSTISVALNDNLTVSGPGTLTIAGNITQGASAESLTKTGAGTLVITGANSFTGGIAVNAGILNFAHSSTSDGNLGATGAPVSVNGGTLQWASGNTDDISSTRTVTFQPGGAIFDTNGNNVTLSKSIGNGGSGSLTKAGAGTLTLSASNTFTGPTNINAGTLAIASNGALGSVTSGAGLVFNGGTLSTSASFSLNNGEGTDDRTLTLNSTGILSTGTGTTLTITGAITGSGGLTVTGGGQVTILNPTSGQNTFSGGTLINDGSTVFLGDGSANINGLGSGLVTLDGGTLNLLYTTNEQTQNGTFTNNIQIDNGFTGTIDATLRGDISGALTGSGTLDMDVDYVRGNIDGNWSAFTGQINVSAGSLGGDFRLNNLNGFGTASLNLGAGVSLYITENYAAGTANINIGALSGAAGSFLSAQGSNNSGRVGTYIVGGANTTATFAGIIQDDTVTGANQPTAITKVGTQAWILTGSNDYSGATTITSGTLQIGNGGNSGTLGTGSNIGTPSTVTDNASLVFDRSDTAYTAANLIDGTGTVTVTGGGTIALTNANGFFGGAIINGGSTLNINGQYALGGADYGGLTFNNGTLQYATSLTGSNGTADISQSSTGTAEPVTFAGNATIDTNGNNVTYADTIGNSGTGGLTIASSAGGGSLTLSATETYTGATNVNTGAKLILASGGALANTAVTVNTGATLLALTGNGGIGTGSGSITLAGGSTLSLVGDSALGNLAVNGGMTVGGSTFADIDLELNTDTSTADTITVTGSPVSYGAAGGLIFLTDISGTNAPATGTPFTLITDPAGLGAANFSLGTTSLTIDGQSYALTLSNSTSTSEIVTLTAASLNFYWTGQAGTSWSNISNFVTAPSGGAAQSGSLSASSNVFLTANSPTAGHVASQTIDGNYIINSLSFTGTGTGAATTAITLGIGSGTALTIDAFNTFSDANANNYPIGTGLVVQPGSAAHIINANINLGSSQTWDINNSPSKPLTMNGVVADSISGSGFSLTKTGTGTLIIANADTYDGGTVVNAGTLMLASGGSLLSTGNLTVGGTGTFDLGGNAQTIGNLSDGGSSGGVITSSNGAGTLTVTETLPNTYSGAINDLNGVNGSVVTLVVSGTSNLILSGSSNFTGGVTLTSGNLTVANNYALGNPTSTNLNAGLNLSPSSGTVTASFTSANPNIASLNGSGNVILGNTSGSGTSTTLIIGEGGQAASSDSIFSGVISDLSATNPNAVGNLEIVGGGLVTLDSANTFTGTTVISGTGPLGPSELILQSAGALENSTLNFNNQGGILSLGSLITMTLGGLTGSEAFSLSNGSNPITLTIGNNNVTSVYTGNLTGPGALVKVGTGSFTVGSGTNGGANYTGNTTVNNGTLVIGGTSSITGNIDVTGIQGVSNLVLADNVVVKTGTIVLIDSGDPTPGTAFPAAASLTLKNNASLTAPNVQMGNASRVATGTFITIQDNASLTTGTLTLVDTIGGTASDDQLNLNGGTLTLNTFNLFTATGGATQAPTINFNGGILAAAASDNPGTVTFLGAFTFLNAKVFNGGALINTNGFDITIAQPLTSGTSTDGGLTAMGAGGILTLTGSNSYLGATTINPGVTLQLGNGTAGSDGTITASGGITDNGTLIYNRAGSPTSGVAISGSGNLVISGTGSQTLTGVNTFTGPTTINTGATLQLGNGAAGNDGTILNTTGILDNGTLIYNRSGVLSTSVAIHGSGNVTMSGTGTQTLAGVDSYTGATTVSGSGGRLIVSGSLTGTTSVSVAPGAHLEIDGQLNPAITPTISGFLNGTGSLGAATIASGGTLAPNFTSSATAAGALTTAGNVNFADGTTTFSIRLGIALPTDANQLNVTSGGLVTLNDATLHLTLGTAFNNATEPANFVYVIINGGAQNTGSGSDVFANAPLTGDSITVANTAIFDVFYAVNSTNTGMGSDIDLEFVGAIPEPSTWAELLAGAALLFLYRRSRRKAAASR